MDNFYAIFTYAFASLFAVINPIGMAAVFLQVTKELDEKKRHQLAYRVAIYGAITLLVSFFVGPHILRFFGITLASLQIAGGMLVFYIAWAMFSNKPKINATEEQEAHSNNDSDLAFFPLTMPITTGAGAMAVIITLSADLTKGSLNFTEFSAAISAIVAVCATVAICYRYADAIFNRLGYIGSNVITRLTAFILLAISITIIWNGLLGLINPLLNHALRVTL